MGTHLKGPAHCSADTSRKDGLAKKQAGVFTTIIPSTSTVAAVEANTVAYSREERSRQTSQGSDFQSCMKQPTGIPPKV
jgi:hypothetical protein